MRFNSSLHQCNRPAMFVTIRIQFDCDFGALACEHRTPESYLGSLYRQRFSIVSQI